MLESIGNVFKKSIDKITSAIFVDKKLIDAIIKDFQRALIMADVNLALVKEITEKIRKVSESKLTNIDKKEYLIKLLNDEIAGILGGEKKELKLGNKEKILLVGLYGTGKTTTLSKIALWYKKRGKKVAMLGLDVHRPAASEQLEQLSKQIEVPAFTDKTEKNPVNIWKKYMKQLEDYDLTLIDSAGRDALDNSLVKEIKTIADEIKPTHILFVIAADIGQTAKSQVNKLKEVLDISGVIITRMDSSAKAGGALTAAKEANAPVYFIGTGEKPTDIEVFNPQAYISRLLGMGDLESLLERVRSATDEESMEKSAKRFQEGKFTLEDFYEQLSSMQSLGPLGKLKEMIPGFGKAEIPDNIMESQEKRMKNWKHAISSMTQEEKASPELLEKQTSRLARIAKGSGTSTSDIRQLLKQYRMIKEFSGNAKDLEGISDPSQLSQKQLMKLAKKFGKKKFKF